MPTADAAGRGAPRAVIFGCAEQALGEAERAFYREADPLGFILFARNCDSPEQIRALIEDLRACVGRAEALVLIDQEGGRVARLGPPHWRKPPAPARIGALAEAGLARAVRAAWLNARLIAAELEALGLNVACTPVLDLRIPGADAVVGDRAFGADPDQVARLGRAVCEGMMAGGILPVIKHMPGHGRAHADSHLAMPRVDTALDELARTDFRPFRLLNDMPLGITAHVSYEAIDRGTPGTLSRAVIQRLIRGQIGFDGLLMTDDLSMAALSGSPAERARKAIAAGCDVVLHCNGQLDEMAEVAGALSAMTPEAARRFARASAAPNRDDAIDIDKLLSEFDNLLDARAGS